MLVTQPRKVALSVQQHRKWPPSARPQSSRRTATPSAAAPSRAVRRRERQLCQRDTRQDSGTISRRKRFRARCRRVRTGPRWYVLRPVSGGGRRRRREAGSGPRICSLGHSIPPAQCPYALYAEQLSGTAFTAARASNQRTCGRKRALIGGTRALATARATLMGPTQPRAAGSTASVPPCSMAPSSPWKRAACDPTSPRSGSTPTRCEHARGVRPPRLAQGLTAARLRPNRRVQLRWMPLPLPEAPTDFVEGLVTMGASNPAAERMAPLRSRPAPVARRPSQPARAPRR